MSPTKRRRPLRVATDRAPADVLAALTHPRALGRAGLDDLQAVFDGARRRVNRAMVGTLRRTDAETAVDVLVVLASGRAIVDHVLADRWPSVRAALELGTGVPNVAAALGLDVDEVRAGLRSWADRLYAAGRVERAGYDEVLALVEDGAR